MAEKVVKVRVADVAPVRSFLAGAAEACRRLRSLSAEDLATLPGDAREGIAELRQAVAELASASPPRRMPEGAAEWGTVVIEWPAPPAQFPAPLLGSLACVYDAATGEQISTCTEADIVVHVDARNVVTADLTLFAGEDGNPIRHGEPVFKGPEILTGVFPFLVSEMRVRPSASPVP